MDPPGGKRAMVSTFLAGRAVLLDRLRCPLALAD